MDEERKVEEESRGLTFKDILFIIRKHWIAIVCFIVTCTAAGFVWSRVETPTYQSTGTMLVSYESTNQTATQEYQFSNAITNTVVAFIKTNTVLDQVSEQTDISLGALKSNLSVSNSTNTLMIKVSYTSSDKEQAKNVVNTIMDVAKKTADTTETVDGKEKPVYHMLYGNLSVIDEAKNGGKVSHTMRNTAIGLGAGVVLALIYVVIRELADNTFKSSEEIERVLNLPVLAGIPEYKFDDEKKGGK